MGNIYFRKKLKINKMLENLFTFEVLVLDLLNEKRKSEIDNLLPDNIAPSDIELVVIKAEYPYEEFRSVEDAWIPNPEGFEEASKGIFNACLVRFKDADPMLVPWTRSVFKKRLKDFITDVTRNK